MSKAVICNFQVDVIKWKVWLTTMIEYILFYESHEFCPVVNDEYPPRVKDHWHASFHQPAHCQKTGSVGVRSPHNWHFSSLWVTTILALTLPKPAAYTHIYSVPLGGFTICRKWRIIYVIFIQQINSECTQCARCWDYSGRQDTGGIQEVSPGPLATLLRPTIYQLCVYHMTLPWWIKEILSLS